MGVLLWISLPVLTVVVFNYWTLVFDPNKTNLEGFTGFDTVNLHSITFVFVLLDFILSSERFYYKNALWTVTVGIAYGVWSIIFSAAGLKTRSGNTYLYAELDWRGNTDVAFAAFVFTMILGFGFASMYAVCKRSILLKVEKDENENDNVVMSAMI